jgi:hypothetical protein
MGEHRLVPGRVALPAINNGQAAIMRLPGADRLSKIAHMLARGDDEQTFPSRLTALRIRDGRHSLACRRLVCIVSHIRE